MIRELVLREIQKHGGDTDLANRLLIYGDKPYLTWLVNKLCRHTDATPTMQTLEDFANAVDVTEARVRYAYFRKLEMPLSALRKRGEFDDVLKILSAEFPYVDLWLELAPYAYEHMRNLAIELLVDMNFTPVQICECIGVKKTRAYKVRKAYLTRYVQMKGDCNDTKHY